MIPKKIILHHSLTKDNKAVSWPAIRIYHMNIRGWNSIGYHFGLELVDKRYEILIGRMPDEQGAHCKGFNEHSIGICFVGNFNKSPVSLEQWQLGLKLCNYLCRHFAISSDDVFGHRELVAGRTCPGAMFDVNKFRKDLMELRYDR